MFRTTRPGALGDGGGDTGHRTSSTRPAVKVRARAARFWLGVATSAEEPQALALQDPGLRPPQCAFRGPGLEG